MAQVNVLLEKINMTELWSTLCPLIWSEKLSLALGRYERYLRFSDLIRYEQSNSKLCNLTRTLEDKAAIYLSRRRKLYLTKIFVQLRLASKHYIRFSYKGNLYSWNQHEVCTVCNLKKNEALNHFLFECLIYEGYSNFYLKKLNFEYDLSQLCNAPDEKSLKNFCHYIINSLLLREFILNE